MVLLDAVVLVPARAMANPTAQRLTDGTRIGVMPVRRHPLRHIRSERKRLAEELRRRIHIARHAQSCIDQIALPIDGALQVAPAAVDLHVGLARVPFATPCAAPRHCQRKSGRVERWGLGAW